MKRILIMVLALVLAATAVDARRKKEAAGAIQDGVYQDNRYDFQFKIHDNWQPRIKKDEGNFRVVLVQKKYGIPPDYANAPDYTYTPRVVIYADTTSMSAPEFLDSLMSATYKTKQKKDILSEFEFLSQPEIIPKDRKQPSIAGKPGIVWQGESKYMKEVSASAVSTGGVRVYGAYTGFVVGVKNDKGVLLLFQVMCESHFHDDVWSEVNQMISSLAWAAPKDGE